MTDTEEPQFTTLKERIAALNQQKNFNGSEAVRKPAPPPPPGRPVAASTRSQTAPIAPFTNGAVPKLNSSQTRAPAVPILPQRPNGSKPAPPPLPRRDTQGSQVETPQEERSAPPPLPSRNASSQAPPTLPRRTSTQPTNRERRGSTSSEVSQRSVGSTLSQARTISSVTSQGSDGRRVPPAYNPETLPPLPPTRREKDAKAHEEAVARETATRATVVRSKPPLTSVKSAPIVNGTAHSQTLNQPPRLPSRPTNRTQPALTVKDPGRHDQWQQQAPQPGSALRTANITGFSSGGKVRSEPLAQEQQQEDTPPPLPSATRNSRTPPPVPIASRPSASQIDAVNTRVIAKAREDCWTCRDWSGPDGVAMQYPRQSLPRNDPVGHLARGLCDPFASYTDKARAIFTWFHYNIAYDTVGFFGKCVERLSVEDRIFSGKAVCSGYADTYTAIAKRAGLECVTVVGHGKGFGYTPLKQGERPPPPKPDGHAWNAVRIDGGRWKLLDACWGAGHLDTSTNEYKAQFSPWEFTRTNEQFGLSHFPKDTQHQFRDDGRVVSWEEYFIGPVNGEPPITYSNVQDEGILKSSIEPKLKNIPVHSGEIVRFQFSKVCEHWRSDIHGKGAPPLLLLSLHGVDGRKDEMVPMETDGYWHWIDVRARDLGAPGQAVQVAQVTKVDGQDARGISAREYLSQKGRVGMSWGYVMRWELV
ncbi:hypothetical protein ACO1O0_004293 [Amphichorda felina]